MKKLIEWCDKEIAELNGLADAALDAFGHDNNRPIWEKKAAPIKEIRAALLRVAELEAKLAASEKMREALDAFIDAVSSVYETDAISEEVKDNVRAALKAYEEAGI